ncbi:TetR/AcrR family transcriptional regulator [uncultured Mycolicibacterium sp.]|uniref:TetR/AcrR family transcriptional regulator n=1 Tax=uncultured Mycolicibacterium sp. TaxID=2320817 RepID=UPI00261EFF16|nr:TetR/AcrR family transcriptional regulator [uncultured Mycolicibacterium sp.]
MAGGISRESYFETGLAVLADRGYGGLKLAEVCNRLGVTTGSFYHYFAGWPAYTKALLEYWMEARTTATAKSLWPEPDPRVRIRNLLEQALELPHGAEAAIRVWSSLDPEVHRIQAAVDRDRYELMYSSALELLGNERQAQVFASCAMYMLIGFEQSTLPRDPQALRWLADQVIDSLESGNFATVPESE